MTTDHTPNKDPELSSATESPLRAVRTPEGVELHLPEDLQPDHRDKLLEAVDRLFDNRTVPQLTGGEEQTTAEIGTAHHADGEVVGLSIDAEYRKPNERDDPSDPLAVFDSITVMDVMRNREMEDPIPVQKRDSGWRIRFTPEASEAGIEAGDYVFIDLETAESDPLLKVMALDDPPESPEDDPTSRKVRKRGEKVAVALPPTIFDDYGLRIDADEYDNQNPLLLDPLVLDGLIGFTPLGFYDGSPFVPYGERDDRDFSGIDHAPYPDVSFDEDYPEPSTPEPVGAIPSGAIAAAAQLTGSDTEQVRDALRTLKDDLAEDTDALADHHADSAPVETPAGTVHIVTSDVWGDLDATRTLDADLQRAVREAHTRAAEQMLAEYAPDHDARGFAAEYDALVRGPDA